MRRQDLTGASAVIEFLFEPPLGVFSVVLCLVVGYWLMVVVGAMELDILDFGAETDADTGEAEGLGAGRLAALGLGGLPVTVAISIAAFWSWLVGALSLKLLLSFAPEWIFGLLTGFVFLFVCLAVAFVPAALTARPVRPFFKTHEAVSKTSLVGRTCTVSTGHVDEDFGQAAFEDGGAGFVLQVRAQADNGLRRGSTALIVDYDNRTNSCRVVLYEPPPNVAN